MVERIVGATSVVVVRVSAAVAATGAPDEDGGAQRRVAWPRSVARGQNQLGYSPRGRSCAPAVPLSLSSSSCPWTTTCTTYFRRSTTRGHVGSPLKSNRRAEKRWRARSTRTKARSSEGEKEFSENESPCVRAWAKTPRVDRRESEIDGPAIVRTKISRFLPRREKKERRTRVDTEPGAKWAEKRTRGCRLADSFLFFLS